ncbi:MAG: hypothetical protein ABIE94_02315 [archaeon]
MRLNYFAVLNFINIYLSKIDIFNIKKDIFNYYKNASFLELIDIIKKLLEASDEEKMKNFLKREYDGAWDEEILVFVENFLKSKKKELKKYEIFKDEYSNVFFCNLNLLYYLSNKNIENLKEEILNFTKLRLFFSSIIFFERGPYDFNKDIATYFLALKWFYSDKTKHLYSEELLREIKDYEEKIKSIEWEKYMKPSTSKFDRLII